MKVGTLVTFNVITDDSCYASKCFGVDFENDWFDIQVYAEKAFGEIVKRNTIEIIYKDGRRSGIFFRIVKGVIKKEIESFYNKKHKYGLSNYEIFETSGIKTFAEFKEIKIINFIELDSLRDWSKPDVYSYLDQIYMNGKIYLQQNKLL